MKSREIDEYRDPSMGHPRERDREAEKKAMLNRMARAIGHMEAVNAVHEGIIKGEIVPFTIRLDIIYAPLFIYCLVNLFDCIPARKILLFPLEELGIVSMEI